VTGDAGGELAVSTGDARQLIKIDFPGPCFPPNPGDGIFFEDQLACCSYPPGQFQWGMVEYEKVYSRGSKISKAFGARPPKCAAMSMSEAGRCCPDARLPCIRELRSGSYFPDWLLERRCRAEAALTSIVATCYLLGVSTRRMKKLVESLGSPGYPGRRSASWPGIWMSRWRRSGPGRWTPALIPSWRRTCWC